MRRHLAGWTVILILVAACGRTATHESTLGTGWQAIEPACAPAGDLVEDCPVGGYPDRPFDLAVPSSYSADSPEPVLVVLHGGGGNSSHAVESACAGGDLDAPNCFHSMGEREGFITVYPNGTARRGAPGVRTWNAGGGIAGYACVSGVACRGGVDDLSYLAAVLDTVEAQYQVDETRVYLTGFSNGAGMAHRLGCEMADRFAAIAPVSGSNQFAAVAECSPGRPVPVIQIHGTDDPCWTYEESSEYCLERDSRPKVGARESTAGWVGRNGCDPDPEVSDMANRMDDGMTTTLEVWSGCDGGAEVRLLTVRGGGHAFPSGRLGLTRIVGLPTEDFGSEVVWEFLSRFSLGA